MLGSADGVCVDMDAAIQTGSTGVLNVHHDRKTRHQMENRTIAGIAVVCMTTVGVDFSSDGYERISEHRGGSIHL